MDSLNQQKLLFHALRPHLETESDVSEEAQAQYFSLGGTQLSLAALRGEEDMVKVRMIFVVCDLVVEERQNDWEEVDDTTIGP